MFGFGPSSRKPASPTPEELAEREVSQALARLEAARNRFNEIAGTKDRTEEVDLVIRDEDIARFALRAAINRAGNSLTRATSLRLRQYFCTHGKRLRPEYQVERVM